MKRAGVTTSNVTHVSGNFVKPKLELALIIQYSTKINARTTLLFFLQKPFKVKFGRRLMVSKSETCSESCPHLDSQLK